MCVWICNRKLPHSPPLTTTIGHLNPITTIHMPAILHHTPPHHNHLCNIITINPTISVTITNTPPTITTITTLSPSQPHQLHYPHHYHSIITTKPLSP
ncbi:hypothetical protein Pcinc_036889 [Petrolisthes cinctipes]|uniref:Uncharacterized protein n=1 Tax=Petrolisthes cinctipes TaxID=88211 RepID=A0AAE1BTN0_PETCI|nr:hypothetical protein Pcinc_036889 [Petrolisthes cinctipes]